MYFKSIALLVCLLPSAASALTAYVALTNEPCFATTEPAAKMTFKVDRRLQKVIYTVENLHSNNLTSYAETNCTIIDEKNWTCDKSFASNGVAFRKDDARSGYQYCHFKKKMWGGWGLIGTQAESSSDAAKLELGRKIDDLLLMSLKADLFKKSLCEQSIRLNNPKFYETNHFAENGAWIKDRVKYNVEILSKLSTHFFAEFAKANSDQMIRELTSELGERPSSLKCGVINGRIDRRISQLKVDI